jgi:hypothetical protein
MGVVLVVKYAHKDSQKIDNTERNWQKSNK